MAIKYKWLTGRLKELIITNIEMGINRLPTEAEIAAKYKVSRQTVRASLARLEQDGLIIKKRGSGSYITGLTAGAGGNLITLLISDDSDYIYPGVIHDIENTLSESGFSLKVLTTANRIATERQLLLDLLDQPPRGVIAEGAKSALPNPNTDLWTRLEKKGCMVVFLHNYYPTLENCLYVKDDNVAGSILLTRHLISQGHQAIGGIFKSDDLQGPERYRGFMETMLSTRLPVPDERVSWFDSDDLNRLQKFQDTRFLQKAVQESLDSCTAVVCYNDMIAYFLIQELKRCGYHLPADMAVAAFDNTYLSNSGILPVTTLSHRPHEMGTAAARLIIDKLKGLPAVSLEVPWTLTLKASTAERREQP